MRHAFLMTLGLALLITLPSCNTTPQTANEKRALELEANDGIADFRRVRGLSEFFDGCVAYAILPAIGKGAVGIGAAHGNGVVYQKGSIVGFCTMTQTTIGLQLGGQKYRELIFFQTEKAFGDFKRGEIEFSANASAVAVEAGKSTVADYENGVAVFSMAVSGLMFEASIGGQDFEYSPN